MPFADDLAERMEPWLNDDLQTYITAIGQMFDPLANIIEGEGEDSGWGAILNKNTFPSSTYNLGYLGQFLGVPLPPNLTVDQELALITAETGFYVGSMKAILGAVTLNLNADAAAPTFIKGELPNGTANPWWFTILYRLTDAPGTMQTTGNVTSGSAVVTSIASTSGYQVGAPIAGVGVPGQTFIKSVDSSTQLTMTSAASLSASAVPLAIGTLANYVAIRNAVAKVQQAGTLFGLVPTFGNTWSQANVEWRDDTRTWEQARTESP